MNFENSIRVAAPLEDVWKYLQNVEAVAPCVPGATLTEKVSDSEFRGTVKVKVGAVQVSYSGSATILEADESDRRIVLRAQGADNRSGGSAAATIISRLTGGESETVIEIATDLTVTGRVAQFGRGIMQEVANRLMRDFASCLEERLGSQSVSEEPPPDATGRGDSENSNLGSEERMSSPQSENDLKLLPLLVDVGRARAARGLRAVAKLLEPDKEYVPSPGPLIRSGTDPKTG